MKKVFLSVVALTVLCTSCVYEMNEEVSVLEKAKLEIEENFTSFKLPYFGMAQTKSSKYGNMFTLLWHEAKVTETVGGTIAEVPIGGPYKLKGAFITQKHGQKIYSRATVKSFLVMEYDKESILKKKYIATYIKKGIRSSFSLFGLNGSRFFVLYSDLDGSVRQVVVNTGRDIVECTRMLKSSTNIETNHKDNKDLIGFRIAPVKLIETKTNTGCPIYECFVCPRCYWIFWGNILDPDFACTECGYRYNDQFIDFCPTCLRPWTECVCPNPEGSCSPCGRNVKECPNRSSCGRNCNCE